MSAARRRSCPVQEPAMNSGSSPQDAVDLHTSVNHIYRAKPPPLGRSLFRSILHRSQPTTRRQFRMGSLGKGKSGPSDLELAFAELDIESHEHRTRPPGKGFCVLSLDGGGCRGYISLLILQKLLRQLQPEGLIYPYLYFDLIAGTSTGGLIAILIAVLHLDIDTAIEVYQDLVGQVFASGFSVLRYLCKDAGYRRKPLKRAIAKILKEHGNGRILMYDPEYDRGCRCFVTTIHCAGEMRNVLAVRSYRNLGEAQAIPYGHSWTCEDAALATTAAPCFFKRHRIDRGIHGYFFEDAGANRMNNPTKFILDECQILDKADQGLNATDNALFVSIGTGNWKPDIRTTCGFLGLLKNKKATLKATLRHATDVDEVHNCMKRQANGSDISYFRLNPSLGGKIGLADAAEIPAMEASVMHYFKGRKCLRQLNECAAQLKQFQTVKRRAI